MNSVKKLSGVALASAAATLLLAGVSTSVSAASDTNATAGMEKAKVAKIKCSGINSCKGTSACATATTACAGQNSCKGQGWIKATKAECDTKGGKVIK